MYIYIPTFKVEVPPFFPISGRLGTQAGWAGGLSGGAERLWPGGAGGREGGWERRVGGGGARPA